MITPEERARERLLKRIIRFSTLSLLLAISFVLIGAIIFNDPYMFFAFVFMMIVIWAMWMDYYLTFNKRILTLKYSVFNLVASTMITITVLTYIVGGFSGAMISAFFMCIVIYSLLLDSKE